MKKKLSTIVVALATVLMTGGFAVAEAGMTSVGSFPYFQLGCLIVGGLILTSLKAKFEKMYTGEVVGAFALYTILVALFTNPVIDTIKGLLS